jgi:hypothetical protein
MNSGKMIGITLLMLQTVLGAMAVFQTQSDRAIESKFAVTKEFYVTGSTVASGESFTAGQGTSIIVLRNSGSSLLVKLGCSQSWNQFGKKVEITFSTEGKVLGKEAFRWLPWNRILRFDSRTLGSASFLRIQFQMEGGDQTRVTVRSRVG